MCRMFCLLLIIGSGYFADVTPVYAAKLTFQRQLEVGIGFTDNATRVANNADNESEVTSVVTPVLALIGSGRRFHFTAQGKFDLISYKGSERESSVNPRISAFSETEIYEDLFFLALSARANQISTDVLDPLSSIGSVNDLNSTAYNLSVSPYINFVYKDSIAFNLRFQYDRFIVPDDSTSESDTQIVGLNIVRSPREDNLLWGFNANTKKTEYPERENEAEVKLISTSLGYVLGQNWLATAAVGSEWIRFPADLVENRSDFWDVGIQWLPSERITIDIGYGERSVGKKPRALLLFKQRRTQYSLYWSRGYADSNFFFTQSTEQQPTGIPIDENPEAEQGSSGIVFTDTALIDERVGARFELTGRRSVFAVDTIFIKREADNQLEQTESWQLGASFGRRLGRSLSASVALSHQEQLQNEFTEGREENRAVVSMSYQF